ncbi:hypothetical protein MRI28_11755 [Nocardiopsis dassonvillei]|uniref:hypothetical protein n=1 Tax=Nocardiopsis dassonvillei TaxID=2014 RepID=UPI00200D3957|nr:hypothetical protein [Nocardiopsis dassonvillei]MCK9870306.1 hypothetical protein [Nocardiopsis dassonvillei]
MAKTGSHQDDEDRERALIERSLARHHAGLPSEGITIEAGPREQMRRDLFCALDLPLDDEGPDAP